VDEAFILLRAFSAIPHFIERCTPQTFQRYREILPKALVRYINGGLSAFCISEALVTLCKKSDEARTWLLYFHFHFPSLEEGVELSQTLMSWFLCVLGQNRVHTTVTSSFCQIMFVLIKDDIFDITSCQQFDVPWAIYNVSTALQAASGAVELRKDYEEVEWLVSIAHLLFKTLFNNDFGEVTSKFDIVSGQMSQCFGIVAELIHDHEMQSNLSICRDCSAILETILEFLFPYYPFPSEMISIIVKDLLSLISLHRQDMRIIEASVSSLVVLSKLPFSFDFADARQIWIESSFREALNFLFTENQPADSFTNIKPILTLLETLASQLEFHNEKRKYQLVSQTRWTSVLTDWISSNQNDVELISKISRLLSFEHIIKYLESLNSPHGSDSNLNMTDALVSLIRLHVQDHNTMISIVEMLYILCKTNQSLSRSLSLNMTCWSALSESLLLHRDHDDFVLSFCQFVCCLCSANESIELFMASLAKMLGKSNLSDDIRCIEVLLQIIQSRFGRQKSRIKRIAALAVEAGLAVCEVITILVTSVVSSKSFIVGNDREVSVVEKGKLQIASLLSLPTHNHDAESQFKVALRALEELSMNMQGGCKSTAQVNNKASNLSTEDISNSVPGVTAIPHDEIELSTMIDVNVYKGTWRKSTAVAVKINRGKKSIADAAIQAELERLCSLRHPRIVSALGLGVNLQIDGEIFHALVLEHMEKGTLRNVLNTEHAIMSTASRLTIAVDVCEGMRFLHESKLFHGSLSSESVLVDVYGRAKLSGLKSINLKKVYQYSQTKRSAKDKEGKIDNSDTSLERDQKDDVFGFGSIIWELMTGKKLPWTDVKQASKKSAKLTLTKEESTTCPAVITAMMKHCLESQPMNRPAFSDISETLRLLHAQESKLWNDQQRVIPDGFICPITHDIMTDPVMLLDGHSYERKVIEDWLTRSGRSPLTNELLPHRTILDNYALKSAIESFLQQNPAVKHSI
jgi:serine/threonine protein kinase